MSISYPLEYLDPSQGNALSSQCTRVCLPVLLSWCVQCLEQLQSRYSQVSGILTLVFWFAPPAMWPPGCLAIEQSEISGFKGDLIDFHSQV